MKYLFVPALVIAFVVGISIGRVRWIPAAAAATGALPTDGWTLHIDADQHFGDAHPNAIAHHFCKPVTGGVIECQLYDSDAPDARLVGVETIVPDKVWATFPAGEQAMWHYHKTELAKIHATLPGLSDAEKAKVVASILQTYGKVWIIWDPLTNPNPIGQPSVVVLK